MKHMFAVVAVATVLAGCQATGQQISQLDPGNNRDVVVATLGRPDAIRTFGDYEVYLYLARHRTSLSLASTDYSVVLKDGRVVQFGPGVAQREGLHGVSIVLPHG